MKPAIITTRIMLNCVRYSDCLILTLLSWNSLPYLRFRLRMLLQQFFDRMQFIHIIFPGIIVIWKQPDEHKDNIIKQLLTLFSRPFIIPLIKRDCILAFIRFNKVIHNATVFYTHRIPSKKSTQTV